MIKRCWACAKELGVAHYCAVDIKGMYCDADCLAEAREQLARGAAPKQEAGKIDGGGWISVKERLPKPDERVLVFCVIGLTQPFVTIGWGQGGSGSWGNWRWITHGGIWYDKQDQDISHWQPLPAPPVIQKGESGRCGDCEYWVNPIHWGEFGTCQLLTFNSSPFVSDSARSQGGVAGQPVRTNKSFGCIEFQAANG